MTSEYTLAEGLYLYPTPAGAYYAVSSLEMDKPRQFLRRLLQYPETPLLTLDNLRRLMNYDDEKSVWNYYITARNCGGYKVLINQKSTR
ncbi:hypothetical protein [Methylocucumis oryzae]|uniref:hypothetical protein n=1 Tax=Methylocucumis oryzae TaxID=1632867 RepID=UPI000A7AA1BA